MRKTLITALAASALALAVGAPVAMAEDTTICRGTIGGETVINVRVPLGATCNLNGTDVRGNVDVRSGASLFAAGVDVGGNMTANGYLAVRVNQRSSVDGDVRLRAGRSDGSGIVSTNTIGGDLRIEENFAKVTANNNRIARDMRVEENRGRLVFNNNRITGAFDCEDNSPAPTGTGNIAEAKQGQCSSL